jgi:hypothetical protein
MPRRDLTLTEKTVLLEQTKSQPPNMKLSPTGGDNWSTEIYNCMSFTPAREIARQMDITPRPTGNFPKTEA